MFGSLMGIISRVITAPDAVVSIGGGAYAVRGDGNIVLAWSRADARSLLVDGPSVDAVTIDVDPAVHIPMDMTRSASVDDDIIGELSDSFDGRTVVIRLAQFGGHGGMPSGTGMGTGGGFGNSNPMASPGQFTNYIARQQFDRSLDQARKGPEIGGWNKSLETRLKDSELYGHTRKERDRDMEPYEMTWEDRVKLRKSRYMQRVREMRAKRSAPKDPDPNSVAAIKAIAPKPDDYISIESRLGDHRETDGEQYRPGYHGPESQFTHFPPPITAEREVGRKVEARSPVGYTSFDDMGPMIGSDPHSNDIGGVGDRERFNSMPAGMRGYQREDPTDIQELWDHYRNGQPGDYDIDLLMDHWAHGTQPGQEPPVFTDADKERIIQLMRQRFYADEQPEGRAGSQGKTIEERLRSRHRSTTMGRTQPTAADQNADPYPYANDVAMRPPIRKHPGLSS